MVPIEQSRAPLVMMRLALPRIVACLVAGSCCTAIASPSLECEVTYAGHTQTVVTRPVADPYPVPAVDIAGRFRFKPLVVGDDMRIRRVLVYVYLETEAQPVLIQQAKYLPPFPGADASGRVELTGQQYLYAGALERELIYQCHLKGVVP
jgi:hypothetical protein